MKVSLFILSAILILFAFSSTKAQDFLALVKSGESARQRGEFARAIENFNSAKDLAIKANDKSGQAQVCNLTGQVFYTLAKYNPAIRSFREAEKLAAAAKDKREEARAWAFLGQLYWRVTKKEDGERLLKDALEAFEKSGDEINIALTLRFLGRLEEGKITLPRIENQGIFSNSKKALEFYERSLRISQRIGDEEGELTTLKEIGLVYQTQHKLPNNLEKAMSYFEPLRIRLKDSNYRRLYAVVLNNIATNEYFAGRSDTNGSRIIDKAKIEKSIETADEAARIFREIGDRQEWREMLDRKAFCLHYLERYAESLPIIEESIRIANELYYQPIGDALDRSRYFESLIGVYRQKMDALYKLNRSAEMFETLEAMKSLALRDLMNRRNDEQKHTLMADERIEEKRLNDELNSINRQLLQVKQTDKTANPKFVELNRRLQIARLAKEEWQANIALENEKINPPIRAQNLNITQLCALVPDKNTAFIEFSTNTAHFGITFILSKTDADFAPSTRMKNLLTEKIALPDGQFCSVNAFYNRDWLENEQYNRWASELKNRISELREQIARNSPAFKANARFIYDALLADGMPLFKDKKHLVLIPSGLICDVPFQALMNEDGRYLIEDFSISYAPSLTALAEMQTNRRELSGQSYKGDFLAFGNPKLSGEMVAKLRVRYRDGRLDNLPEAETEVRTIGKFYSKNRIALGSSATEDLWLSEAANYRILHLATHGLSDGDKPLYSHVLLSANVDADGLIEAREIAEMNLTAEMVVLSACETARGREIDGEGMVGLAWSFAAAGVPVVVASSWKVDSENTAGLMIDFYSKINEMPALSKAAALRHAALKKLNSEKTRHPFFWAGFSIFGDWEN